MEELSLFKKESTQSTDDERTDIPIPPLSPTKKAEEIESLLNQYEDSEMKLIALAQILK